MCPRFALAVLVGSVLLSTAPAPGDGPVTFTARPRAQRVGPKVRISFTASEATDVEVAVLDSAGRVVRHLAAARLGPTAPGPFQRGPLSQHLVWDGRDDNGEAVADLSTCKVRVGLGLTGRWGRVIGWSGQDVAAIRGLAAGPDGALYVVHGEGLYAHRMTTLISAFDREGRYLRQVFPGPANLPAARRVGWPHIKRDDGKDVPVIGHMLSRSVVPGAVFSHRVSAAVTGDGRLVMLSGAAKGTTIKHADVRGGRRLLILGVDGGVPADYLGPEVAPAGMEGLGHLALSPDDRFAYVAGLFEGGRKGRGLCNVVWSVPVDGTGKATVFAGEMFTAGAGEKRLNDPQGLATDAKGNVYVADYGNGRIAAFRPDGSFLGQQKVENPDQVRISRKTGALYVVSLHTRTKPITDGHYYVVAHNWKGRRVLKFASPAAGAPQAMWTFTASRFGGGAYLALDESGPAPVLWVAGMRYFHRGIVKLIDRGDAFEDAGNPIGDRLAASHVPPLGFIGDVAVTGPKVIARHPVFGLYTNTSYVYDARTGRPAGTYVPKAADGRAENKWNLMYGEMTAGKDGNLYVQVAGKGYLRRYDPDGAPLPFASAGQHYLTGYFHGHTRPGGVFADRAGRVYVLATKANRKIADLDVRVVGADGRVLNESLVKVQTAKVGGIAVDRAGNVYVGAQVSIKGKRIPEWAAGKLPPDGPRRHPSIDYKQCGAIIKFGPEGGGVLSDPDGDYQGLLAWRTGGPVRLAGAEWIRRIGCHPVSHELGCFCETTRFDVDGFGRVFVPDLYRFCVIVLDGAGNEVTRFGTYGNMDSRGPGSPVPEPAIAFGWPLSVRCADDRAYVVDLTNRRIVSVEMACAVRALCPVK